MQRRVLLGVGAAVLALAAGFFALRSMTRNEAGKAVDQTIDQIVATLPPGYGATHGTTDVNPITGSVVVHDFAVSYGGRPLWAAEKVSLTGVDQQALNDIFDPHAYPAGRPAWTNRRTLVTDAAFTGWHSTAPGSGAAAIEAITLHHLDGRPFTAPPTPEVMQTPSFRADSALAFAVDSLELHGLSLNDSSGKHSHITLASLQLHGYDGGFVQSIELHDAAFDGGNFRRNQRLHAGLGSIDVTRLDARPFLQQIKDTNIVDQASLAGLSYASSDMSGFDLEVSPGPRIALQDLHGQQSPGDAGGIKTGEGSMTGLTISVKDMALPPPQQAAVAAFGMNSVTIDAAGKSRSRVSPAQSDVTEDLDFHQLGKLHLSLSISGYNRPAAGQDPKAALLDATLDHATVEWDDGSLVNRVLSVAAHQAGTTVDVLRAQLAIPVVTAGLMVPDQPDVADQLTAFLNHPNTLVVTLNPPQKVTLAEVGQAPATSRAHLLGLHIEAK
jgi:hypothetical protein